MGEYLSQFTFYDVMGYLLPGLVGLCASLIGLSAINPLWAIPRLTDGGHWTALIIASYFVGHAVQGLSSRVFQRRILLRQIAKSCTPAVARVVDKALQQFSIEAVDMEARFAALDALKLSFSDREVFIARQGFFRGSSFAFGLFALAMLAACICNRHVSLLGLSIERALSGLLGFAFAGITVIYFLRYRDFLRHEIEFAAAEGAKHIKPK